MTSRTSPGRFTYDQFTSCVYGVKCESVSDLTEKHTSSQRFIRMINANNAVSSTKTVSTVFKVVML